MNLNICVFLLLCISCSVQLSVSFLIAPSVDKKSSFRTCSFANQSNIIWKKCDRFELHSHTDNVQQSTRPPPKFYVRKARYMELGHVVEIVLEAFYNPSALIRPYLFLSELSRLQGNFPYDDKVHAFYVACCMEDKEEKIIGFVDVDKRDGKKISDAPRPYLSDLAVHSEYRRMGVAKALVRNCELESLRWGKDYLFLRVDKGNNAGLKMYEGLKYEKQEHPYFGVGKDTTILLKREFDHEEKDNIAKRKDRVEAAEPEESYTYVI
jgi:ribosomal protein S18 acetylase RimI-like enzyme